MNTNGLAKLYAHLTPRERVPLILAASVRGDEAERDRLARSAPVHHYRLPDYHGVSDALLTYNLYHVLELLDLSALLWRASALLAADQGLMDKGTCLREGRLLDLVRFFAYLLVTHAEAWEMVAAEWQIDAEALLAAIPGYRTAVQSETTARDLAFSREEATAWLRKTRQEGAAEAPTVEGTAQGIREFLEHRIRWWG